MFVGDQTVFSLGSTAGMQEKRQQAAALHMEFSIELIIAEGREKSRGTCGKFGGLGDRNAGANCKCSTFGRTILRTKNLGLRAEN